MRQNVVHLKRRVHPDANEVFVELLERQEDSVTIRLNAFGGGIRRQVQVSPDDIEEIAPLDAYRKDDRVMIVNWHLRNCGQILIVESTESHNSDCLLLKGEDRHFEICNYLNLRRVASSPIIEPSGQLRLF